MSALTDEQIKAIEDKGGKRWTKGEMDRIYINAKDLGLKVEYYKSGNVSGSWFDGDGISHAEAYRVMNSKVWIDVKTGELCTRFERIDGSIKEAMTERAQAILDEATAEPETVEETVEESTEESAYYFVIPCDAEGNETGEDYIWFDTEEERNSFVERETGWGERYFGHRRSYDPPYPVHDWMEVCFER